MLLMNKNNLKKDIVMAYLFYNAAVKRWDSI